MMFTTCFMFARSWITIGLTRRPRIMSKEPGQELQVVRLLTSGMRSRPMNWKRTWFDIFVAGRLTWADSVCSSSSFILCHRNLLLLIWEGRPRWLTMERTDTRISTWSNYRYSRVAPVKLGSKRISDISSNFHPRIWLLSASISLPPQAIESVELVQENCRAGKQVCSPGISRMRLSWVIIYCMAAPLDLLASIAGLPEGSTISTGPYFSITILILLASPTATTCIVAGLMYFFATRWTSSALIATSCPGYLSQ